MNFRLAGRGRRREPALPDLANTQRSSIIVTETVLNPVLKIIRDIIMRQGEYFTRILVETYICALSRKVEKAILLSSPSPYPKSQIQVTFKVSNPKSK